MQKFPNSWKILVLVIIIIIIIEILTFYFGWEILTYPDVVINRIRLKSLFSNEHVQRITNFVFVYMYSDVS